VVQRHGAIWHSHSSHAARCHPVPVDKHFNADFYVTCATVIPVLFLALVVQGGTYENMLRTAMEAAHRHPGRGRDGAASAFLPAVAYLTLVAGVLGEAFALGALFSRWDTTASRATVMVMTLFLLVVIAAGPAWKFFGVQRSVEQLLGERNVTPFSHVPVPGAIARPGDHILESVFQSCPMGCDGRTGGATRSGASTGTSGDRA
jgi:hypothetical protein